MKSVLSTSLVASGFAVLLAGCINYSSEINLPSGEAGYRISCPANIINDAYRPEACVEEAGKVCGSSGYRIIDRGHDYMIVQCQYSSAFGTATPKQHKSTETAFPRVEKYLTKVSNHENCELWDVAPQNEHATKVVWSGQCVDGKATGFGEAIFYYPSDVVHAKGKYRNGYAQDLWEVRSKYGKSAGLFHDGDYVGEWTMAVGEGVIIIGSFKDNQPHGTWKFTAPTGESRSLVFVNGQLQE